MTDASVIIQKNGKLWSVQWDTDTLGYALTDVSHQFKKHLFDSVSFGPALVWKDLLMFARLDIEFWEEVLNLDLVYLKNPMEKSIERSQDYIDEIHFQTWISQWTKEFSENGEASVGLVDPDISGFIIKDPTEPHGIDHQPFNLYLDKPVKMSTSYLSIGNKKKNIELGKMSFSLISIMRLVLSMHYEQIKKENIEYIINWDK